jgi:hypothetical protein
LLYLILLSSSMIRKRGGKRGRKIKEKRERENNVFYIFL